MISTPRGQPAGRLPQFLGLDEQRACVVGGVAVPVQVRRAHRGGERLADAVEHQLHRSSAEVPAAVRLLPAGLQSVKLNIQLLLMWVQPVESHM